MLNPIDTGLVFRGDCVTGRLPADLHMAVPEWLGCLFVDVMRAENILVSRNGEARVALARFARGAINSRHWRCRVHDLGAKTERDLLRAVRLSAFPAARVTRDKVNDAWVLTLRFYHPDGVRVTTKTGLGEMRRRIDEELIPAPVDPSWRGEIISVRTNAPPNLSSAALPM